MTHSVARIPWPEGKEFAFTILDDTDDSTVQNTKPIYDLLSDLGLRTTKTVWPVACPEGSRLYFAGQTMADPDYRAFAMDLARQGFEVTWHCATMESSARDRTERGLDEFRRTFGDYPAIHVNHGQNRENIYWGWKRYSNPLLRVLQRWYSRGRDPEFAGEEEGSPYFWGDLCREHVRYVRGFTWRRINTLSADPQLVYRLARTPYVRDWFSTSDAADVHEFRQLVTPAAIDRLRREGGVCILSTHLGKGFVQRGAVDPTVEQVLRYLSSLPGWFVPVSPILDHVTRLRPSTVPRSEAVQAWMELRHGWDRARGIRAAAK